MYRSPRRLPAPVRRALPLAVFIAASLAALISVSVRVTRAPNNMAGESSTLPLAGVLCILDPGHGGTDSGAICRDTGLPGGRIVEATVNYRLAATTAAVLKSRGARVEFTVRSPTTLLSLREGDQKREQPLIAPLDASLVFDGRPVRARQGDPGDLYRRAAAAQQFWAQTPQSARSRVIFLSLHCDKLESSRGRGARLYRDARAASDPQLAVVLKRRLTDAGLTNSRGGRVIAREFGVLNGTYNPISERVLLEAATLSHRADRRAVVQPAWRWRLAHLIADAIGETMQRQ